MRTLAITLLSALVSALSGATAAAHAPLPHTRTVVVRPVHADGTPAAGWHVTGERDLPGFSCAEGTSPVAVSADIRFCGASADDTVACWKSTGHTVLCLRDPQRRVLARIAYSGTFAPVAAPAHPSPEVVQLFDGRTCTIRDGGAWARALGHPTWHGTYFCGTADLYGADDGIGRNYAPWLVHSVAHAGTAQQTITARRVEVAYLVGTAS